MTGVGLDDEQFIKTRQKTNFSLNLQSVDFSNVNDKGSTNSIMFFLAAAGIPFTFILLVMLYYQDFVLKSANGFSFYYNIINDRAYMLRPFFLTFVMSGGIYIINSLMKYINFWRSRIYWF